MSATERLLSKVIGRCTGPAWNLLRSLRVDPSFDAVVARLALREGTLFVHDVEHVIAEVLGAHSHMAQRGDGQRQERRRRPR